MATTKERLVTQLDSLAKTTSLDEFCDLVADALLCLGGIPVEHVAARTAWLMDTVGTATHRAAQGGHNGCGTLGAMYLGRAG